MKLIGACVVVFLALSMVRPVLAGEFTADITKTEGEDRVTKGTLHVKGDVYRMEFEDPAGPTIVSISDPKNDKVLVLVPRLKMYMEDKYSSSMSRMNDPFALIGVLGEHYEKSDGGKESISGRECRKDVYGRDGQVVATVWHDEKLGFPLKIQVGEDRSTVVSNVKEKTIEAGLLAVPEGYEKSDQKTIGEKIRNDPELKAKREAWQAAQPKKSAVSKSMTAGSELRLLVGGATKVSAGLSFKAPEAKWSIQAFRGGKPLGEPATHTGKVDPVVWEGEVPDQIVVKFLEGRGYMTFQLKGKAPLILATKLTAPANGVGGPDWSLPPKVVTVRMKLTADAGGKRVVGKFSAKDSKGKGTHTEFAVEPGESTTFEAKAADGVTGVGYLIQSGTAVVEVVEDYRPEGEQKPF